MNRPGRLRSMRGGLAALALVVVLASCSSAPPPPPPLPPVVGNGVGTVAWRATVGSGGRFEFTPAVVGDAVYAAAADGTLVRFDARTGREAWRLATRSQLAAGVGASDRLVVVGSLEGVVDAYHPDGKPAWQARVQGEITGVPLVTDDLVVVRTVDSKLFGLAIADGKRRWVYQRAAQPLTVRASLGAVAGRSFIYAGFPGGKLVALVPGNGGLRWEGTVALPKGATELERVSDVVGAPWLTEREVCAVAFQGSAACFDNHSGATLWTREMGSHAGLHGDGKRVFVSETKGAVAGLDLSTGSIAWRQDAFVRRALSAPLPLDSVVVVGDHEGRVHLLDRETGGFSGRIVVDETPIVAAPQRTGRGAVVQTRGGTLLAIGVQ